MPPCGLVHRSRNLRVQRGKRVYSSLFDDFRQEERMNLVQDGCWDENGNEIACAVSDNEFENDSSGKGCSSEEFGTMKPEERDERKVNSVGIFLRPLG